MNEAETRAEHIDPALAAALPAIRKETRCYARLYSRMLAALDALKKSLLHQAFSGQL